jgi:NADPH-dependent 2,4-dienoyl-CoA reductase/sulfur reductase-like enzyme
MAKIVRLFNQATGDDRHDEDRITWDQFVHALGADPRDHDLSIHMLRTDAMEPTLRSGEIVLIDRSVREVIRPGIYLIAFHRLESFRRVAVVGDGLILSCDNRIAGEAELVPAGEIPALDVLGRVRSVWRRL